MEDQRRQEFYKIAKGYLLKELKKKDCSFDELKEVTQSVYEELCKKDPNKWKDLYSHMFNPDVILFDEINNDKVRLISKDRTYFSLI